MKVQSISNYCPFFFFVLLVIGCKTSKVETSKNQTISEFQVGKFNYYFSQDPSSHNCNYDKLPKDGLVQFLELNQDGDRDDRVPRKLMSYDEKILSRRKSDSHVSPLEVKLCMDRQGQIVALRYINEGSNQNLLIREALQNLSYGSNQEAACVECKDLYVYTQ